MADYVFNIALGRVAQYFANVEADSPTGCTIDVIAVVNGGTADGTARDYDTLSALLGDASIAEATNTNYARLQFVAANVSGLPSGTAGTPDDTNDRVDIDVDDPAWTSVTAGDNWTDLVFAYNPTGASADTAIVPLINCDFAVTPDGSNITAQVSASGLFRAS